MKVLFRVAHFEEDSPLSLILLWATTRCHVYSKLVREGVWRHKAQMHQQPHRHPDRQGATEWRLHKVDCGLAWVISAATTAVVATSNCRGGSSSSAVVFLKLFNRQRSTCSCLGCGTSGYSRTARDLCARASGELHLAQTRSSPLC